MRSRPSRWLAETFGPTPPRGLRRSLWIGAASFAGVLSGLCISAGASVALVWAAVLLLAIAALAHALARGERPHDLVALALFAGSLHMAVAIGIHTLGSTSGGFVTGDDRAYYRLASAFARYLQGAPLDPGYAPPYWGGEAFLFGAFVYLETGLFMLFGPDVRIPILLNASLAVVSALFIFHMTRRLFESAAGFLACAVVALAPSLILWSSLNLKDSLTTLLAILGVWAVIEYQAQPRARYFALQFVIAQALIWLRAYVAGTIAIAAFLGIVVATRPLRRGIGPIVLAGGLAAFIVLQSLIAIGSGFGEQLLVAFERERAAMAVGARTGFVPTPTPLPSSISAPSPSAPILPLDAHPDDIAPAPGRTLSYLPTGLAFAIFAPVPLFARRVQEIVAAPEMLAWYILVIAAIATVLRDRHRWYLLAPLVLTVAGLMLVLALAEGNVGTLFRHRGMVIPFAAALASPTLVALWAWRRSAAAAIPIQEPPD